MQRWPRFLAKGNDFPIGFFAFAIDPGGFPVPFTLRNDVANGIVSEIDHEVDPAMKGVAQGRDLDGFDREVSALGVFDPAHGNFGIELTGNGGKGRLADLQPSHLRLVSDKWPGQMKGWA